MGHSRAQESARDAAGVGRSWPVRAHQRAAQTSVAS
jgi:hypothetical protein